MRALLSVYPLLLFSIQASAATEALTDHFLRALAGARSPSAVSVLRGDYERARIARTACEIELRERLIPADCFDAADLENRIFPDPAKLNARRARLNRLCLLAAEHGMTTSEIRPSMSVECAKAVRQAQAIQAYRAEEGPEDGSAPDSWSEF